jgi:hypothetical protein
MKDITVRRYSYEELDGEAKAKAVLGMQLRLQEWLDSQEIEDHLKYKIEQELGGMPEDIELAFSLSYCQGDGVAIYGKINKDEAPSLTWPTGAHHVRLERSSISNHYSHWNSFNIEIYDENYDQLPGDKVLNSQLRDLCRQLENYGYRYIEDQTSEQSAIEYLEMNYGDEFLLDGTLDNPKGAIEGALI